MTLFVVGVGAMGSALAARLRECGHEVIGIDPFLAAAGAETVSADGVPVLHSLGDARARGVHPDEVLVFVRLADQVIAVLEELDADDWFDAVPVTVLSTIAPGQARSIAQRFGGRRTIVEAPVSGGVGGARQGALTFLLAGEPGAWLAAAASTVFRFPLPGLPATAKLLNNALGAANAHALTAALSQADGLGLDAGQMLDVIRVSSGGGWMADHFWEFPEDLLWKDFVLLNEDGPIVFPSTTIDTDLITAVTTARSDIDGEEANERQEHGTH